jgi:hypothetical protein
MHKGYKCLDVSSGRVYVSRDVTFDENIFPFSHIHSNAVARLRSEISCVHPTLLNPFYGVHRVTDQLTNDPPNVSNDLGGHAVEIIEEPAGPGAFNTEEQLSGGVEHEAAPPVSHPDVPTHTGSEPASRTAGDSSPVGNFLVMSGQNVSHVPSSTSPDSTCTTSASAGGHSPSPDATRQAHATNTGATSTSVPLPAPPTTTSLFA